MTPRPSTLRAQLQRDPPRAPGAAHGAPPVGDLTRVLTIGDVARMAGWDTRRMWEHLRHQHELSGGTLLVDMGRGSKLPRWTITMAALKSLHPAWFRDDEAVARELAAVREQIAALGGDTEELQERVRRLELTLKAALGG